MKDNIDRERVAVLLYVAALRQTEFWDALGELEAEIDGELESTSDLRDHDVNSLLEMAAEPEEIIS